MPVFFRQFCIFLVCFFLSNLSFGKAVSFDGSIRIGRQNDKDSGAAVALDGDKFNRALHETELQTIEKILASKTTNVGALVAKYQVEYELSQEEAEALVWAVANQMVHYGAEDFNPEQYAQNREIVNNEHYWEIRDALIADGKSNYQSSGGAPSSFLLYNEAMGKTDEASRREMINLVLASGSDDMQGTLANIKALEKTRLTLDGKDAPSINFVFNSDGNEASSLLSDYGSTQYNIFLDGGMSLEDTLDQIMDLTGSLGDSFSEAGEKRRKAGLDVQGAIEEVKAGYRKIGEVGVTVGNGVITVAEMASAPASFLVNVQEGDYLEASLDGLPIIGKVIGKSFKAGKWVYEISTKVDDVEAAIAAAAKKVNSASGTATDAAKVAEKAAKVVGKTDDVAKAGGNIPTRTLTEADLGIKGNVKELKGTFSIKEGIAEVRIDMIDATIANPLEIIEILCNTARAGGANTLKIEGTLANPRLLNILSKRYNAVTQGANEVITITLK